MKYLNFIALTVICCICNEAYTQENYEIQVYGSQTQAKKSTIFELHTNYTFDGEKNIKEGVRPSYHAFHETIEITHGITNNFELGFYLFFNYTSTYGYKILGTHIRPRIKAPDNWNLPMGLSLSAEIGTQSADYSAETWNVELRPIIDKQWTKWYVSFNPTLGVMLAGVNKNSTPAFAPNLKISYAFLKNISLGIEYYGDLGYITAFEKLNEQSHAIFAVFDLLNNKNWELNVGPGWGLTSATDKFVSKILLGKRIYWRKK